MRLACVVFCAQNASKDSTTRSVLEFMGVLQPPHGSSPTDPSKQQQLQQAVPSAPAASMPPPPSINLLSMPLSFDYLEVLTQEERVELGAFIAQVSVCVRACAVFTVAVCEPGYLCRAAWWCVALGPQFTHLLLQAAPGTHSVML